MIGYSFLSVAEEETSEAALFYEAASLGLGSDFLDDLQQSINTVRAHPEIGAQVGGALRRVLLHRFPFSLIYSVETDEVLIVSIAHHRQRPGYWNLASIAKDSFDQGRRSSRQVDQKSVFR